MSAENLTEWGATPNFPGLIENSPRTFDALTKASGEGNNGGVPGFFEEIKELATGIKGTDTTPTALANLADIGQGFTEAKGLKANSGHLSEYGMTQVPAFTIDRITDELNAYSRVSRVLQNVKADAWRVKNTNNSSNSFNGNPYVLKTYERNGRIFSKDGVFGEYNWNAPFVGWVLSEAGLEYPQTFSPLSYANYGNTPVNFRVPANLRRNDIVVLQSPTSINIVGFIQGYNPETNKLTVLGGNFNGTVGTITFDLNSPQKESMRITHVRRNWDLTEAEDVPLFDVTNSAFWNRV